MKAFTIIFMTALCFMLIMCSGKNFAEPDTYYIYTNGNVVMIPHSFIITTSNWQHEHYPIPTGMEFIAATTSFTNRYAWTLNGCISNNTVYLNFYEPASNIGKLKHLKLFFMLTE